jgi:hypothetical protein
MATVQSNPSWQLKAVVKPIQGDQHHLLISSYVPIAHRPEEQVRFTGIFTSDELRRLRDVINQALEVVA